YLERRNVIHIDADVLRVDNALAERDPALAQLAAAAVSGLAPAGPELRRRPVEIAFDGRPGVVITAALSVREVGFSLHAATRAGADERGRGRRELRLVDQRSFAGRWVAAEHGQCDEDPDWRGRDHGPRER